MSEMKILSDEKNALLNRREIKAIVNAGQNPGFENAVKLVSEQFKSPVENIALKTLKSKFGRDTFLINAMIYDSLKAKESFEPKKKVKKGAAVQSAQAAPAKKK